MIVKVFEKTKEFTEEEASGKAIMDYVLEEIGEKEMSLGYLEIDGEAVNNKHIKYIDKNKSEIKEIKAVAMDKGELVLQNAAEIRNALAAFPPIMDVMAEDFRLGVSARGWKEFENMINTFLYIDQIIKGNFSIIISMKKPEFNMAMDKARTEYMKLYEHLNNIERALKYDKPAEAGDIIQKKVKPVVEKTIEYLDQMENLRKAQ